MVILVAILVFAYVLGVSYHFNKKEKDNPLSTIMLYTLLDAFIVICIFYLSIMSGFIFEFYTIFIVFFLLLGLLYIRVQNGSLINDNFDLKFEAFKNIIIVYVLTVYPFFIGLTIFRYFGVVFQLLLSLAMVAVVYFLAPLCKKGLDNTFNYFRFKIRTDGVRKFVYIWVIIAVVAVSAFLFNMPKNEINNFLNLNNHRPLLNFTNGYPIDLRNNYEAELLDTYNSESSLPTSFEALSDEGTVLHRNVEAYNIRVFRDEDNNITYTSYIVNSDFTVYIKDDNQGSVEIYEINGIHNTNGYVIDDVIYLTSKGNNFIEVMDGKFEINGIFNLQPSIPFYAGNEYMYFEFQGAEVVGDSLIYRTHEQRGDTHYYKEYALSKVDIDIHLPFYSHYSYGALVIVFIFMFIPITNYKEHITVVDLDSKFKQKAN